MRCGSFVLFLAGVMLLGGCGKGPEGPPRYPLAGAVTFQGRPVPKGTVTFEPDASQGNKGPGVVVSIKDGKYATEPGPGTVGGAHVVRIQGFDGQPATLPGGMEMPDGKPLFPDYTTQVDLSKETREKDFEIPAAKP